jgi:hypothetical protein
MCLSSWIRKYNNIIDLKISIQFFLSFILLPLLRVYNSTRYYPFHLHGLFIYCDLFVDAVSISGSIASDDRIT